MKEAVVDKTTTVTIHDVAIPSPQPGQVLIRVVVSGTNPKDWKMPQMWDDRPRNQGDDIAGYVEAVGDSVKTFRKGDKVAAFHEMLSPHGSYGEYAIAWEYTTFHLPDKTSFEEAATIPLCAMTAALGLYQRLGLPLPWNPAATQPLPLVVYGGAGAVGAYAIKFAKLSNIHPLIVVAGKGIPFVETLIDKEKGDTVIDYREGDEAVRAKIKSAAGRPIHHAFDAVSEKGSIQNLSAALMAPAKITVVLQPKETDTFPDGVQVLRTMVGSVHNPPSAGKTIEDQEFGAAFFHFIGRGLAQGWFSGHPYEVRKGGLNGLQGALENLAAGRASAVKYVVRIAETEGV